LGHEVSIEVIMEQSPTQELSPVIHAKLLDLVAQYLAIGGMPEAVKSWREFNDPRRCSLVHAALLDAYRQDFEKYAKKAQLPYLHILFDRIPHQFGKKFNYSKIGQELRKRELAPCLDLLITAGVIHKTMYSAGQGIPIGAQADPEVFKVIFVDVALSQKILGLGFTDWLLNPLEQFVNKGDVVEAFVGQELLAYADPLFRPHLSYWRREERASEAEVDYLTQLQEHVIPIEVKSGAGSTLKSMHMFLESHTGSPYGLRFSTQNYSGYEKIHSYPLYAVAQALGANVTL
ncbi:MAG TPA: DUF4143 domain-containing protein, partial [Candidatus Limnocylindria bacterium]|nr:DUF4143 domain-containing protein [Candidatus Limnocylindria bacterium]